MEEVEATAVTDSTVVMPAATVVVTEVVTLDVTLAVMTAVLLLARMPPLLFWFVTFRTASDPTKSAEYLPDTGRSETFIFPR